MKIKIQHNLLAIAKATPTRKVTALHSYITIKEI